VIELDKDKQTPKDLKEMRVRIVTLETRAAAATPDTEQVNTVVGSIKYNSESQVMVDWYGDSFVEEFAPGAFNDYLSSQRTIALWCHRTDQILGNTSSGTLRLINSDTELGFECDLPNNTVGGDAWESVQRRDVDGVSFGFISKKDKWAVIDRDGKKVYKRTVLQADLPEVTLTPFAAYTENKVDVRSLHDFKAVEQRAVDAIEKEKILLELEL
jgi:HK97 family phage prohead protease